MATKTSQIIEILNSDENLTQREVSKRVGCTEGYVSRVKKGINKDETSSENEVIDPDDSEYESDVSTFIKSVKIEPDPDTLTDKEEDPDNDTEEYECGGCGHVWVAGANDYQAECPKCGERF